LTPVLGSVVRRTQRDERIGIVVAAFGPKDEVVEIEKNGMATPWNHAAPAIAAKNATSHGRWHILMSSSWEVRASGIATHVGGFWDGHVLGVALRHLDDSRVDFDVVSLPTTIAFM
jgi:hypothetical protein